MTPDKYQYITYDDDNNNNNKNNDTDNLKVKGVVQVPLPVIKKVITFSG